MTETDDPWEAFWRAGELSAATGPALAARINDVEPVPPPSPFAFAAPPVGLARPRDALAGLLAQRRSTRAFADGRLPAAGLGSLLSAFADNAEGRRAWPSAGGLYPLEVFALLLAVDHPLDGRAAHYEPAEHALTDLGPAPGWDALCPLLSADVLDGTPQVVVLFVVDTAGMARKYGPRAGRFALIEVGHAAQSLAVRLAADGLAGCELGGAFDRAVLAALGLERPGVDAKLALAYACGLPGQVGRGRRGRRPR